MPIAQTGDVVHWADGKKTTFNLLGDLQSSRFPNTDEAIVLPDGERLPGFFDWFEVNWATPPADGKPGVRQSLIVDAETISNNVGRLLELMRDGVDTNGKPVPAPHNEWGVPPGPITPLMAHAAAAVRFPDGWAGSQERRKYMPGSVATDPQPKPPTKPTEPDKPQPPAVDQEKEELRKKLAEALAERDRARQDAIAEKQAATLAARDREAVKTGVQSVLDVMKNGSKKPVVAAVPTEGGGKFASALRFHKKTLEGLLSVILLALLPLLAGCASLRALLPGGVTPADAEFDAVVSGAPKSIIGSLDPQGAPAVAVLEALGVKDPIGVFLPVVRRGETTPVYLLCTGDFRERCQRALLSDAVHVAGQPTGPGGTFWKLSRLTVN